ncbi:hypothetical protein BGZ98_010167 [Dissophora globulifera]|nr:hypothetical protein BGZ98_010167 [Dissophora globulifera]
MTEFDDSATIHNNQHTHQPPISWEDWRVNSQVYHNDRWDRASVFTTDSEVHRHAEDPDFPDYPERNDYWQRHCSIRERRRKQHNHHHYPRPEGAGVGLGIIGLEGKAGAVRDISEEEEDSIAMTLGNAEDDSNMGDNDFDRRIQQSQEVEQHPAKRLKDARRRLRPTTEGSDDSKRPRQQRVRYSTYTDYVAAIQRKSKERTERRRSFDSTSSAKSAASAILTAIAASSVAKNAKSVVEDESLTAHEKQQLQQRRLLQRKDGINQGRSQGGSKTGQPTMHLISSPRRQHRSETGILFVPSTTTTAEVYATLSHDPQKRLPRTLSGAETPRSDDGLGGHSNQTRSPDDLSVPNAHSDAGNNTNSNDSDNNGTAGSTGDSVRMDDSRTSNECSALCSPTPSLRIRKEDDHCLSQPGLYASHNHILPLQRLLELQEQEQWRVRQLQGRLRQSLQPSSRRQKSLSSSSLLSPSHVYNNSPLSLKSSFLSLARSLSSQPSTHPPSPLISRPATPSSSQLLRTSSSSNPASSTAMPQISPEPAHEPERPQLLQQQQRQKQQLHLSIPSTTNTTVASSEASTDSPTSPISSCSPSSADQPLYHFPKPQRHRQLSAPSPCIAQEPNDGHMLLMLVQGQMRYYKDGNRKSLGIDDEPNSGESYSSVYYGNEGLDQDTLCGGTINGDEEAKDEEGVLGQECTPRTRQTSSQSLGARYQYMGRGSALFAGSPLSSSPVAGSPRFSRQPLSTVAVTATTTSSCISCNALDTTMATTTTAATTTRRPSPCLGRMRGAKARASVSFSVLPTMATPSLYSSSAYLASSSTANFLSNIKMDSKA